DHFGLPEVAAYWHSVVKMNDYQKARFSARIVKTLFNTVADKKIAVLGFAFKKDTNDTRESAAITICRDLLTEQAKLSIYDPKVTTEEIFHALGQSSTSADGQSSANVTVCRDAYQAAAHAHAVVVVTEWDEFKKLDYKTIYQGMMKPAFLFDGRNILDVAQLQQLGFRAFGIGK
ncbi:MAG: UDP binding domain-containing protein, partial [Steroidobacter sp.]